MKTKIKKPLLYFLSLFFQQCTKKLCVIFSAVKPNTIRTG